MNPDENQLLETRRSFVRKSLAASLTASVAGLIKAHGEEEGAGGATTALQTTVPITTVQTTTPPTTYKAWIKRITKVKKVVTTRPGNNPYSAAELQNLHNNYTAPPNNPFPSPPGTPDPSIVISGPTEVDWTTDPANNLGVYSTSRDPDPPTISSHYDAASNTTWSVYFYDFVEVRAHFEPTEP